MWESSSLLRTIETTPTYLPYPRRPVPHETASTIFAQSANMVELGACWDCWVCGKAISLLGGTDYWITVIQSRSTG